MISSCSFSISSRFVVGIYNCTNTISHWSVHTVFPFHHDLLLAYTLALTQYYIDLFIQFFYFVMICCWHIHLHKHHIALISSYSFSISSWFVLGIYTCTNTISHWSLHRVFSISSWFVVSIYTCTYTICHWSLHTVFLFRHDLLLACTLALPQYLTDLFIQFFYFIMICCWHIHLH
jgi:hypothetical protein